MKKHTGKILIMALATIIAIIYFIVKIEIESSTNIDINVPSEEIPIIVDSIANPIDTLGFDHPKKEEHTIRKNKKKIKNRGNIKKTKLEKESKEVLDVKPDIIEREAKNEIE